MASNCGNNICVADAGNQVGGYVLLNSAGDANFTNTITTILGVPNDESVNPPNSVIGGNLDVEVTDANQDVNANGHATLTMDGRVHAQGSGDTNPACLGRHQQSQRRWHHHHQQSEPDQRQQFDRRLYRDRWTFGLGTENNGVLNLHAQAPNGFITINPGNLNIGTDLTGPGLLAQSVLIFGNGTITQNANATGVIATGDFDAHALNDVTLTNAANAITGRWICASPAISPLPIRSTHP